MTDDSHVRLPRSAVSAVDRVRIKRRSARSRARSSSTAIASRIVGRRRTRSSPARRGVAPLVTLASSWRALRTELVGLRDEVDRARASSARPISRRSTACRGCGAGRSTTRAGSVRPNPCSAACRRRSRRSTPRARRSRRGTAACSCCRMRVSRATQACDDADRAHRGRAPRRRRSHLRPEPAAGLEPRRARRGARGRSRSPRTAFGRLRLDPRQREDLRAGLPGRLRADAA